MASLTLLLHPVEFASTTPILLLKRDFFTVQLETVEGVMDSAAVMQSALAAVSKKKQGADVQNAHVLERVPKLDRRKVLPLLTAAKVRRVPARTWLLCADSRTMSISLSRTRFIILDAWHIS